MECCFSCGFLLDDSDLLPRNIYASARSQSKRSVSLNDVQPPLATDGYSYRPINFEHGREIRILLLSPGRFGDELQCDLQHANLQLGPVYEAVSYTWADHTGDDSFTQRIRCGRMNKYIRITKNCESVLRRLRKPDEERRIWIDSICIDQTNIQERNHQIQHMIAIFRSAVQVVIYLGEGVIEAQTVIDYVAGGSADTIPSILDAVRLFQCRWFHRVWVLQEVAVAKSATVIYGPKSCRWNDLVSHGAFLRSFNARREVVELPPVLSFSISRELHPIQSQENGDLLSVLQISRNCACKDSRDKVYAVRGIVKEDSRVPLSADYSSQTSAGWVFLQVAAWSISKTQSLQILSYVCGKSELCIPSWVPDWTISEIEPLPPQDFTAMATYTTTRPKLETWMKQKEILPMAPLNYPLDCVLKVRGQRLGNVWPDSVIFRESSNDEMKPQSAETPYRRRFGNYREQWILDWSFNWITNPSLHLGTRACPERMNFWRAFGRYLWCHASNAPKKPGFHADIPPAFGGFCSDCLRIDLVQWACLTSVFPFIKTTKTEDVSPATGQFRCICTGVTKRQNWAEVRYASPDAGELHKSFKGPFHYFKGELDDFIDKMRKYGRNRRVFATEYSLGLGPENLEYGDAVWLLDGANVPFILRPSYSSDLSREHYTVIGECYLHAAIRSHDFCAICRRVVLRTPIESNIKSQPPKRPYLGTSSNRKDSLLFKDPESPFKSPYKWEDIEIW